MRQLVGHHATPPVVMDTNVLVAGACRRRQSCAYGVLCGVLADKVPLILTPAIALEYQDVLLRPAVMELTGLSHGETLDLVTDLIALSVQIQTRLAWRPNLQDETDNKFVEAAIHAAAIIVTYNVADYRSGDLKPYGWTFMTPSEFVSRYDLGEGI